MFCAIILAAGQSSRMNNIKKQFYKLNGKMIIEFSINAFLKAGANEIVVAIDSAHFEQMTNFFKNNEKIKIVPGGQTRQESAVNSLKFCSKKNEIVLIHDAARPFINPEAIKNLIEITKKTNAATLASFATDTIKLVENEKVQSTLNREKIALAQTPQAFSFNLYKKAIELAQKNNQNFTDDCQLVENLGVKVTVVENSKLNFKITTPLGLKFAKFIVKEQNFD